MHPSATGIVIRNSGRVTSRALHEAVLNLRGLKSVELSGCPYIDDEGMSHLARASKLENLELSALASVYPDGLEASLQTCQLKSLHLGSGLNMPISVIATAIATQRSLQDLTITFPLKGDDGRPLLDVIARSPTIEKLKLRCVWSASAVWAKLSEMPRLSSLSLSHCEGIDADALRAVLRKGKPRLLSLYESHRLGASRAEQVDCRQLESLSLSGRGAMAVLAMLTSLHSLAECEVVYDDPSEYDYSRLIERKLRNAPLRTLSLSGFRLTCAALAAAADRETLTELHLRRMRIHDPGLSFPALSSATALRTICIEQVEAPSGSYFKSLVEAREQMESLTLRGTDLDGEQLASAALKHHTLRMLQLDPDASMSQSLVNAMLSHPSLEVVYGLNLSSVSQIEPRPSECRLKLMSVYHATDRVLAGLLVASRATLCCITLERCEVGPLARSVLSTMTALTVLRLFYCALPGGVNAPGPSSVRFMSLSTSDSVEPTLAWLASFDGIDSLSVRRYGTAAPASEVYVSWVKDLAPRVGVLALDPPFQSDPDDPLASEVLFHTIPYSEQTYAGALMR